MKELKYINIEPTNICNLNCRYCSDNKSRPNGRMSLSLFEKIIDQCPEGIEVRLFLSGEPLFHPDIGMLIKIAKEHNCTTLIHTNGTLLMARGKQLIENGLDKLSISIDGSMPKEYEATRGFFFSTLKKQVNMFLDMNKHKIHTTIQSIIPVGTPPSKGHSFIEDNFEMYDLRMVRYPHSWDIAGQIDSWNYDYEIPCFFLEHYMSIYWDGRVPLCCADLNGRCIIGDVNQISLSEVWTIIQNFKQKQINRENFSPCKECERYGNQ